MFTYLASPYSVLDENGKSIPNCPEQVATRKRRYKQVCKKAAELMEAGEMVFCPIAHSHSIEVLGMKKNKSGKFWLAQDLTILQFAHKVKVYRMEGWEQSKGIKTEIKFANELNIPVEFID